MFSVTPPFNSNGHYYALWKAVEIANLKDQRHLNKEALAFYTELPDKLKSTTAFYSGWPVAEAFANFFTLGYACPKFERIQWDLHSLCGGPALSRQKCLAELIQKEMASESIVYWRLGFLLHAYGDAFAHSYRDDNRFILDPNRCPRQKGMVPNPHFGERYLYRAPLGHALEGHAPDLVRSDIALFHTYFTNLVQLLNGGPLSKAQVEQVRNYLVTLDEQLSTSSSAENEIFRSYVPRNTYNPDGAPWTDELSRKDFERLLLTHPVSFKVELPSDSQVDALNCQIQKASLGCQNLQK